MTEGIDWHVFNATASGRPPRRIISRAIAAAGGDRPGRVALDIGAGGGSDALEFVRHGWTVHAYDIDDTLASRLVENERMAGTLRFHHTDATTVERFPTADVLYSGHALPMLGPEGLAQTWPRLVDALRPGGIAAVDLFGDRDTWADRDDIATLDQRQIDEMFRGFSVLHREVRDEDGRSWVGKKHWHIITVLARKL
ncbi:class I SAM-dependent methyltransferase [Brachybacterium sillae]|uniref:class I SAM-dependent methyltransferase n=1 Tax=Brachybacterium sillae TaxID=2810536 RepID=UPI00217D1D5F|nr:class I SAM-dependent methyltransferase [Brachybacterium sillae]